MNAREQLEQFLGIFFTRFSKPRLKFLRQMLYGIQITKSVILNKIAAKCHTPHASVVAFNADGEEKDSTIHYGAMPVRLPENPDFPDMHEKDLRLVVVRGFGQCAMLILTTLQGDGSKEDVWRVVQGYLTRECAERNLTSRRCW